LCATKEKQFAAIMQSPLRSVQPVY